jgi:hypothetical protein
MKRMVVQSSPIESIGEPTFPNVLSNTFGTGPFGTCSSFNTFGYTDTSSLPLGHEQAAIFCIPIGERKNGVNERENYRITAESKVFECGINSLDVFLVF